MAMEEAAAMFCVNVSSSEKRDNISIAISNPGSSIIQQREEKDVSTSDSCEVIMHFITLV